MSAACGAAALGVLAPAASAADAIRVTVGPAPVTRPLPAGFLGLGLEYSTVLRWTGGGQDPVLEQLIRNLTPVGRPAIRVGGQSTDRTWWPVAGMAHPPGVTYTLTPQWTAAAGGLARSLDARMLLGINLEAGSPPVEREESAQLVSRIGARYIGALELGNEPTLYSEIPWYRRLGGRVLPWYSHAGTPVYGRGPGWGPAAFARQYARALGALPPGIAVAGPETGQPAWMDAFRVFVGRRSRVRILTSHAYALNQCVKQPSQAAFPSVAHLLGAAASRSLLAGVGPYIALAHADGLSYRIDELGSVSCNGRAGVSDTMASALWLLDALFALRRGGVDGVNLHTFPGSVNGLFDLARSGGGWAAAVHPLYYGALMFARAAPAGSRWLAVSVAGRGPRVWATRTADGVVRVVLINDALRGVARVAVRLAGGTPAGSSASVERLSAPSAGARSGVMLDGGAFPRPTTTGLPPAPAPVAVAPSHGGYTVAVPAASAALLAFRP